LKQAFETHLKETEQQKNRLEQIFEMMQLPNSRMKCKAMEGLIEESQELIDENATPEVKDAGLIAAAQKDGTL
jgi:ferritin-like metal-binding protein YciE